MSLIEEQFVLKTNGNEAYRVLVNFWSCIKIHVPNILSCVSQVFPHYTKHDASHSNAILDSVERILGKDAIEKLSVTDLWLLLCSAYYHDIGMYISGKEIEKCFKSDEFKNFLYDIKDNSISPLNKYAVFFESKDGKLKYDNCDLTLDSFNAAKYLLAEFFRKSHADRSGDLLQSDSSVTQMFSEINRLITIIADICRLHGEDFKEVMKFSDVENGVNGIEDYCHPRFVACMLRIGDLLDFDSSRVSKPSLDHLSTSIPYDSKIHNEKNYCIKHALITPEKVDVLAECKDVEVAFEIDRWFTSINEEMSNQRNYWHDIVADLDIKGFPMRGNLNINLLGYEIIDNNLKPKFEVDNEKVIKILQGSGIYDNKFECIREILQNAVDATYLRIFLEKLKGKKEFAPESIEGFDDFLKICKQPEYQIEVRCKKKEIEDESEKKEGDKKQKKKYVWHFEIQDHGIGLRKSDLKFLMKIGSGKNNKDKFNIIKEMPEYAKPSGIFGIGFQSIFLITEKVNIKSRYAFGDEVIDVDVGTPLKGGFAVLKTKKDLFSDKGTIISFDLTENIVSDNSYVDYDSYYNYFNISFDFLKNKKSDVEVARILNAVYGFSKGSYLNITCYNEDELNKKENIENKDGTNNENEEDNDYKRIYQDDNSGLIVEIPIKNIKLISKGMSKIGDDRDYYSNDLSVLYRNQNVGSNGLIYFYPRPHVGSRNFGNFIHYIDLEINILSGSSDQVLSVDRESFKMEYVQRIIEPLKRIIIQWLDNNWKKIDDDGQKVASMFIEYYGKKGEYEDKRDKWKELKICNIEFGKEFEKEFEKENKKFIIRTRFSTKVNKNNEEKNNQNIRIVNVDDVRCSFIGYALIKHYGYGMYYKRTVNDRKFYYYRNIEAIFEKRSEEKMDWCFDSMDWSYWLKGYREKEVRLLMPCFGYEKLQIKEESNPENGSEVINMIEKKIYPRTVCPYIVKDKKLIWDFSDELVQWVYENKKDETVTKDVITQEFDRMKEVFSKYVDADGEIIDKFEESENTKHIAIPEIASKLNEQVDVNTKPEAVPNAQKQSRNKAKSKGASGLKKQGNKKKDSNKEINGKAQKAKTKKS